MSIFVISINVWNAFTLTNNRVPIKMFKPDMAKKAMI